MFNPDKEKYKTIQNALKTPVSDFKVIIAQLSQETTKVDSQIHISLNPRGIYTVVTQSSLETENVTEIITKLLHSILGYCVQLHETGLSPFGHLVLAILKKVDLRIQVTTVKFPSANLSSALFETVFRKGSEG